MSTRSTRLRALAFAAVVVLCATGIAGYSRHVMHRAGPDPSGAPVPGFVRIDALPEVGGKDARPFAVFRSTALGDSYGHVTLAYLDAPDGPRSVGPLVCERVHYASGTGLCLETSRRAVTTYRAVLFDQHFTRRQVMELAGPPSRARVSPDGRRAAFTVFISGHAYSTPDFATRTSIVDASTGTPLVDDLEAWPVTRDGAAFKAPDFNFWGVTFAHDPRRFYATLGTGGNTFLVEGDLSTHQLRVIAEGVECPSLSPDDRRIAFKHRETGGASGRFAWHIAVLELSTGRITVLKGETRSVDDQVAWNDSGEILYGMPVDSQRSAAETDVWAIAADDSAPPRRWLSYAFSPAVAR
jgi:hypothetical protein